MKKNGEKIFWGLFFILGAIFILVSRMGYFEEIGLLTLFLTVLLAALLIKSIRHIEFTGILFSLAFLAILYDKPLGIEELTPWPVLGAALLGSIGLEILFHNKKRHNEHHAFYKDCKTVDTADESCINYGTTFGSSIKYVNCDDFRQLNLDCTFGAMQVYFDHAIIQNGSAELNLRVSFAGMDLFIPKEWQVINHATAVFGGIDEKNHPQTTGTPILTLTGSVAFGGVEIHYV
jgi:predicted membrane protein